MLMLEELMATSAAMHHHLCPRQVLGIRMGLAGGRWLDLAVPQTDKRLLVVVETDGCVIDGLAVATGCRVGRRTMRVLDFGKVAATFVDTTTGQAVRIAPHPNAREQAKVYAPDARNRWEAYLLGYQRMPEEDLLRFQPVTLTISLEKLLSKEGYRVECERCGEEIFNEREVIESGQILCRACAGEGYYVADSSYHQNGPVHLLDDLLSQVVK
ncbi:MAG: formylmethanofuran dehydrogenase [Anaerolineales bacterium]|nr:formylmethanofuran dehydrogenase [Anaerolineales bacterium]